MKNTILVFAVLAALAGCRERTVYCVDIGDNIKSWTVYDLNDSIVMQDQLGNISNVKLNHYDNKKPYYMTEEKGWFKKKAVCVGKLEIWSSVNFFALNVESGSSQTGETKYPDTYAFRISLLDATAAFNVEVKNGVETVYSSTPEVTPSAVDYTSIGGTLYPEALVFNVDTTLSNINAYNFVYVKNQGLVEFSTRMPQRTWKVQ